MYDPLVDWATGDAHQLGATSVGLATMLCVYGSDERRVASSRVIAQALLAVRMREYYKEWIANR